MANPVHHVPFPTISDIDKGKPFISYPVSGKEIFGIYKKRVIQDQTVPGFYL